MTMYDAIDYIKSLDDSTLALAICDNENDEHIGNISLQNIHPINRSADLAVIIGYKKYWGQGYGYEACKLIVEHAFKELNLRRISCGTFNTNYGMQAIANKLCMKREGMRKEAVYKNGQWLDVIEYGLLRT